MSERLKHVFGRIWRSCNENVKEDEGKKVQCACREGKEEGSVAFGSSFGMMRRQFDNCRNNKRSPQKTKQVGNFDEDEGESQTRDEHINWFEFARQLVHQSTNLPFYGEDQLHLFKLPVPTT